MTDLAASLIAFPARDGDRLRLALRGLVAALDSQAEAVAALRGELRGLAGAVGGLEGTMGRYRTELAGTAEALQQAGEEARSLDRLADGWLAATQQA